VASAYAPGEELPTEVARLAAPFAVRANVRLENRDSQARLSAALSGRQNCAAERVLSPPCKTSHYRTRVGHEFGCVRVCELRCGVSSTSPSARGLMPSYQALVGALSRVHRCRCFPGVPAYTRRTLSTIPLG